MLGPIETRPHCIGAFFSWESRQHWSSGLFRLQISSKSMYQSRSHYGIQVQVSFAKLVVLWYVCINVLIQTVVNSLLPRFPASKLGIQIITIEVTGNPITAPGGDNFQIIKARGYKCTLSFTSLLGFFLYIFDWSLF